MAIGRISGPLLKSNLLRNGVDLAFENDLLYLDVNNQRIGVNLNAPQYDLDVNGTINATEILTGLLTVDNVQIDNSTIQSIEGNLVINPATEDDRVVIGPAEIPKIYGDVVIEGNIFADNLDIGGIIGDSLIIGNFSIDGDPELTLLSTIATDSSLYIEANGAGTVELRSNTNITGELTVSEEATIAGITVEDLTENRVVLVGENGKLIDSANLTFDNTELAIGIDKFTVLAASGNTNIAGTVDISGITNFNNETESTTTTTGAVVVDGGVGIAKNLNVGGTVNGGSAKFTNINDTPIGNIAPNTGAFTELSANGLTTFTSAENSTSVSTGAIVISGGVGIAKDMFIGGNVDIDGNITVGGNITLGDEDTNTVTVVAEFVSDLIPNESDTYNLGTEDKRWLDVYADSFNTLDLKIKDNLISSEETDIEISAGEDNTIQLQSNTNITGTLDVSEEVTVAGISVEDLTENRVVFVGEDGTLIDSDKLTFTENQLFVDGDLEVTGNIVIGGNITIGDEDTDSITVDADFTSNLIPDESNTYDLGTEDKRWRDVYADSFNTLDLKIKDNLISSEETDVEISAGEDNTIQLQSNTNITGTLDVSEEVTVAGIAVEDLTENRVVFVGEDGTLIDSDKLTFDGSELFVDGDIEVTGNIVIGGNITIGNEDVDSITVIADFTSDLIPDESDTYDLGTPEKEWRTVYAGKFIGEVYGGTY